MCVCFFLPFFTFLFFFFRPLGYFGHPLGSEIQEGDDDGGRSNLSTSSLKAYFSHFVFRSPADDVSVLFRIMLTLVLTLTLTLTLTLNHNPQPSTLNPNPNPQPNPCALET